MTGAGESMPESLELELAADVLEPAAGCATRRKPFDTRSTFGGALGGDFCAARLGDAGGLRGRFVDDILTLTLQQQGGYLFTASGCT